MNNPPNPARWAPAELLAWLVASHLLAKQLTGGWLSRGHIVESTTLWLRSRETDMDVVRRVMLSGQALEAAQEFEAIRLPAFSIGAVSTLLHENQRLDCESEIAKAVRQHCVDWLAERGDPIR